VTSQLVGFWSNVLSTEEIVCEGRMPSQTVMSPSLQKIFPSPSIRFDDLLTSNVRKLVLTRGQDRHS
jgi:hypothetical protein